MEIQIPSDQSGSYSESSRIGADGKMVATQTYTLPKLTQRGRSGSVTIVNGAVTSYTRPT